MRLGATLAWAFALGFDALAGTRTNTKPDVYGSAALGWVHSNAADESGSSVLTDTPR